MTCKIKTKQLRWLVAMLMLVVAMVMPSTAWAQSSITPSKPSGEGTEASPYQISSAAELYWFAGLVNGDARVCDYDAETNQSGTQQNKAAWAKLTADIVVNSNLQSSLAFDNETGAVTNGTNFNAWTPIGNNSNQYTGTFDGANHTISGLYFNSATDYVGLFGYISNGTIKNVGVVDSYLWGRIYVGGVCGYNDQGTMENCYNKGTVSGAGNHVGGVCGDNRGTISNCYNTGAVRGDKKGSGGVCGNNEGTVTNCYNIGEVSGNGDNCSVGGVCGNNFGTIANCYSTGTVSGNGNNCSVGGVCGLNYGKIKNCYYDFDKFRGAGVYNISGKSEKVEDKTTEQFKNGEVAYLLSQRCEIEGITYDGSTWGQNLSDVRDEYPVFNSDKKVFRGFVGCKLTFSNNENELSQTQAAHDFNDEGFCDVCNAYQPATKNESDVYEIRNAGQLYWFAALVNGDTSQPNITEKDLKAKAKLMNDITVNQNVLNESGGLNSGSFIIWNPIGSDFKHFKGTFDGNNHTISGLYYSSTKKCEVGLFGCVANGGVIKNFGVVDSYFQGIYRTGGLCGYVALGTISNCYNASTVVGVSGSASVELYVGGICGKNDGTITNCYSRGKVDGPSNDNSHVGGLCGFNNYKYITNCYYDSKIYTGSAVGKNLGTKTANVEGKTTAQFKSGEVAWLLNGRKSEGTEEAPLMWYQNINTGTLDAYPLLGSNGHGIVYASAPCPSKFSNTNDLAEEKHNYVANADYTIHTCTKCGETHNAVFTVNDETDIISACHDFGSVTLNAPTGNLTYDKTAKAAYIEGALTGIETPKILYKEKNATEEATETAPIDAGTYTASITYTIGGVDYSVSVEYTIEKAEDVPNRPYGLSGCIGEKLSIVSLKDNEGWSWDNPGFALTENAENITVKASYNGADKDNYINITAVNVTIKLRPHNYTNGFCERCGGIAPAQLVSKNHHSELINTHEGYYAIESAGQLYWFAGLVNGTLEGVTQNESANAVLTGNIDLAGISNWTPIGNESNKFGGTFDGKNFKVQNLSITQQGSNSGLFGYANGATIQNICIDGNITLNTTIYTEGYGSIAGCMEKSTISNCHSSVNFTINTEMDASKECIGHMGGIVGKMNESNSTESYVSGCSYSGTINMGNCNVKVAAGIVGYAINSEVPITNCSFTGTINSKYEGALYVGGIFGYTRTNGNVKVTNCLQAGTLEKPGDSSLTGILIGQINNGYGANAVTNNYYTASTFNVIGSTTETPTTTPATLCTTDELKSGEICYLLNGSSPDGGWGQKLGTDSYPVPGSDNTVYSGYKDCLAITYSNNQEELSDNPVHHYDNGFCIHCDGYESATLNANDEYEIGNAGQLYWFAGMVNGTLDGVAQNSSVNAVLTADITVNENVLDANGNPNSGTFRSWMPIGNSSYICTGIFDGRGHTVSGLYFNDSSTDNVGMFGYIKNNSDFRITNVGVVDSYFRGNERVGGVCGANYYCFLENTYFTGTVCGNSQVGGLCGFVNQGSITNCSNVGSITSTGDYVGGLCGYLATNTTIINSYNAGAVSGNGSNVGSIYGINSERSSIITSCYYLDDEESDTDANTTFKTASQFNSGELAYLLAQGCDVYINNMFIMHMDGSAWGQQLGEDNYPVPGSPYKLITTAKKSEDNTYWATFSNQTSDVTLSVPSTRMLKVYNATVSGGKLTLSTRTESQVAKGEGVLLKTDGEYVNVKANETDGLSKVDYAYNNLVATPATAQTVTADGDYTLYRLTYNKVSSKEKLGFYLSLVKDANGNVDESSVGKKLKATPGKAYLNVRTSEAKEPTTANLARAFAFPGDDGGTTDIECITVTDENLHRNGNADDIYDLQGRKVSKPAKGVYIKNNKLFLK